MCKFVLVCAEYSRSFKYLIIIIIFCNRGLFVVVVVFLFCHDFEAKSYQTWHLFQTSATATRLAASTGISCLRYMQAWRVWRAYSFRQMDLQIRQLHRCC